MSFSYAPKLRFIALLFALVLVAAACSGDDDFSDIAADADSATSEVGSDVVGDAEDPLTPPTIDTEGPVDPATVGQLASSLLQSNVEGERLQCLVEDADGDTQLTALYNGFGASQITPEGFTALTGSIFGCFEPETLATSIVPLTGVTEAAEITTFTSCVAEQITTSPNGDLAYTGLAAILVGFAVPEGAQPTTLEAATTCIPADAIVNQMAAGREQASGFTEEVDRECVNDEIDDSMVQAFWAALVAGTPTEGTIDVALEPCTSSFDSGLPSEIPATFVPWQGEGVLAGIDPPESVWGL